MEFGVISSINIMVVFVLSICIIPILASFSKKPKERHLRHLYRVYSQGFIERIVRWVTYRRAFIYISSINLNNLIDNDVNLDQYIQENNYEYIFFFANRDEGKVNDILKKYQEKKINMA